MSPLFDGGCDYPPPMPHRANAPDRGWLTATPCSEIEEERVSWLWRGYIPRAALTLLEGPPKAGKSTVLANIIARVTSGLAMPDGQPCERPGAVLMLSDEDNAAAVIVPRLRVAGARLDLVRIVKTYDPEERPRRFVIGQDTALLEGEIEDAGAVLVVVDPLSIYMGAVDAHRELEVRQVLWYLTELAERTGVSMLSSRHWNKARTGDALAQGGGTVGFSAAARAILSVAQNPDDKSARVLAVGYSNYATEYPSLAFHLDSVEGEDVARVVWDGISPHSADSLAAVLATPGERSKLQEAVDFLDEYVGDREVPVEELEKAARAEGVSWTTLKRAKGPKKRPLYVSDKAPGGDFWFWRRARQGDQEDQGDQTRTNSPLPMTEPGSDGPLPGKGDAFEGDLEGGQL